MNIDDQYQADLCDLSNIAKDNDNFKFVLTVINCFSRFASAVPLKSKHGKIVAEALDKYFVNTYVNVSSLIREPNFIMYMFKKY